MTLKQSLQKALELLGPNGEHWAQLEATTADGRRCAIGAIGAVSCHSDQYLALSESLRHELPEGYNGNISKFNDDCFTTFADVKALFERAIAAEGCER